MASHIDGEPKPRLPARASRRALLDATSFNLPRAIALPEVNFLDVLNKRRSATGATLAVEQLSSLLWHAMQLRTRGPGRFGVHWESRSAPSAGGLHPIRLIVLPLDAGSPFGTYDDRTHALLRISDAALALNRASIAELLGPAEGTTIQLAADAELVAACYENHGSLLWRDAGALTATMCLIATALGLTAMPLGRTGDSIVRATGLPGAFIGAGAVHVGSPPNESEEPAPSSTG